MSRECTRGRVCFRNWLGAKISLGLITGSEGPQLISEIELSGKCVCVYVYDQTSSVERRLSLKFWVMRFGR